MSTGTLFKTHILKHFTQNLMHLRQSGRVAQEVEHLPYKQEALSLNLILLTKSKNNKPQQRNHHPEKKKKKAHRKNNKCGIHNAEYTKQVFWEKVFHQINLQVCLVIICFPLKNYIHIETGFHYVAKVSLGSTDPPASASHHHAQLQKKFFGVLFCFVFLGGG